MECQIKFIQQSQTGELDKIIHNKIVKDTIFTACVDCCTVCKLIVVQLSLHVMFEVFTAVTMNNVILDIKNQFIPHWKHIKSPL
jgi:hypothetical protein